MWCKAVAAGLLAGMLIVPVAGAKTYKWVDEKGVTHYGDRVPPQYAKGGNEKSAAAPVSADEQRAREQEARRQVEQRRQDVALLATYANDKEIDDARARDLKRVNDWLATNTAGLAKSKSPEDRKKLEELMAQGRRETDAINAKYDGYKARYLELKGRPAG